MSLPKVCGQTSNPFLSSLSLSLSTSTFFSLVTSCHGFKGSAEAGLGGILGTAGWVGPHCPLTPLPLSAGSETLGWGKGIIVQGLELPVCQSHYIGRSRGWKEAERVRMKEKMKERAYESERDTERGCWKGGSE